MLQLPGPRKLKPNGSPGVSPRKKKLGVEHTSLSPDSVYAWVSIRCVQLRGDAIHLVIPPRLVLFLAEELLGVDPDWGLGSFGQLKEGGEEVFRELFG